jgi:DNA (cytosine-5)-methyltransferase 1
MARREARGLTFVDLFAGIGGFHVALESLGAHCVFACEIDPACQATYETNFGITPHADIRPLTEGGSVDVPEHDILCAGFPCQPFSKSGFQLGMSETRGTLFFNILKILEARRPRFAILENVRNLAGPRQRRTWDTIIRNLRALGYRVAYEPAVFSPHLLPPERGGRPQVRERVFLLARYVGPDAAEADLEEEPLVANRPVDGWNPREWRIEDWLELDSDIEGLEKYALRPDESLWIDAWNDFIQVIDEDPLPGFPLWVDAFLPRPVIPRGTPAWKRNFLVKNSEFYVRHKDAIDRWVDRHEVRSFPSSRQKFEWQARGYGRDLWKLVMHLRPSGIRVKGPTYLPALVAITQTSIIGSRRRRITPREAARLQGFPDDFKLYEDDAVAYRQLGNAVNVGAVQHVVSSLISASRDRTRVLQHGLRFSG